MANTPMWLDSFDLLLCDLDGGSRSTDFARVFDPHEVALKKGSLKGRTGVLDLIRIYIHHKNYEHHV